MTDAPRGLPPRPMSPHLQVWRWHITMWASILNRATGMALYVGALLLAVWAIALAAGPDVYYAYMSLLASPLGRLVLFGLTVSLFFHLANGVRHLVWDAGRGFQVKTANAATVFVFAFTIAATLAVWVIAAMTGAL
jgi:succinate dehydrogenase / fumarate reductase, cytochrome b subunit